MIKYETLNEAQIGGTAPWDDIVEELNDFHVAVFRDKFPVVKGHLLFVPQYNTDRVILSCFYSALLKGQRMVAAGECDAFNIGINMGKAAGQTVMYPHVHLIPRCNGDVEDPIGGVRNVIPGMGNYKSDSYTNPCLL